MKLKETQHQVTFASIQSAARNLDDFNEPYSLIIIEECHRVNLARTYLPDKVLKPLSKDKTSNEMTSNDKTFIADIPQLF